MTSVSSEEVQSAQDSSIGTERTDERPINIAIDSYDGNHQRYEQIFVSSGGTERTFFVGGLLEKVQPPTGNPYYRNYVFANGKRVAVVSRRTPPPSPTYYLLTDHLGSTNSILNSDGSLFINESYGAFGNGRDPTTWSGSTSSGDQAQIATKTSIGFTGETTNWLMGLVNLNGRILDSAVGRMLSPDPQTPNPGNTQSWNRYSYVNNNPLSYTDHSGFYACPPGGTVAACKKVNADIAQGVKENQKIQAYFDNWISFLVADSGKWSIVFAGTGASQDSAAGGAPAYYVINVPLSEYGFSQPDLFILATSASMQPNSSLEYIGINAVYLEYDPDTGVISTHSLGGESLSGAGGLGTFVPSQGYGSLNTDAANDAFNAGNAAYKRADYDEYVREMNNYYRYCGGCSSGPAFDQADYPRTALPPEFTPSTTLPAVPLDTLPPLQNVVH